jgi:hypothetical protein
MRKENRELTPMGRSEVLFALEPAVLRRIFRSRTQSFPVPSQEATHGLSRHAREDASAPGRVCRGGPSAATTGGRSALKGKPRGPECYSR